MPLRGGGVGPLMANAILNFHFDFPHPSLMIIMLFTFRVVAELEVGWTKASISQRAEARGQPESKNM